MECLRSWKNAYVLWCLSMIMLMLIVGGGV